MQNSQKMKKPEIVFLSFDTIVIGSGSAAFNAADSLYDLGRKNIAVVTEGIKMGTSRNTGSDKQTYYKLTLAGKQKDSVYAMAEDLFSGGGMNGDHALIEAAYSVKAFMKLVLLGVPFPTNAYGEYIGYQTDHDSRQRATSAGPLTSKYITECLERSVINKGITILDQLQVFEILTDQTGVIGVLCIEKMQRNSEGIRLYGIYAKHVIAATGGPAGCYYHSVYPKCHTGMSGMLFAAGAKGANMNRWQYGLASVKFRWNVSGTYQQVLPRYFSRDKDGKEYEFLEDYFKDPRKAADLVFLKGYQWPFDPDKLNGSSQIDMLVYRETIQLGRRVYMDFRTDPAGVRMGIESLGNETVEYLKKSDACISTPIARLEKMNPLAIQLYKKNGIDLYTEPLEVCVCAQHHNGGADVDENYQTCVSGLYVAGEAAGIYGEKRPGGSALNSCQVSSMRAAEHIAYETQEDMEVTVQQVELMKKQMEKWCELIQNSEQSKGRKELLEQREYFAKKMSACAAHIRNYNEMKLLYQELQSYLKESEYNLQSRSYSDIPVEIKNRDIFLTQMMILSAMQKETEMLQETEYIISEYKDGNCCSGRRTVRGLPSVDNWFESVWKDYRERRQKL